MESSLGYSSRFPYRDRDQCSRMCTETLERSNSWAPLGCRNCPTQTPHDVTAEEFSACWSSSSPFAVIKYCDICSLRERESLSQLVVQDVAGQDGEVKSARVWSYGQAAEGQKLLMFSLLAPSLQTRNPTSGMSHPQLRWVSTQKLAWSR